MPDTVTLPETVTIRSETLIDTTAFLWHLSSRHHLVNHGQDTGESGEYDDRGDELLAAFGLSNLPVRMEAMERAEALTLEWAEKLLDDARHDADKRAAFEGGDDV